MGELLHRVMDFFFKRTRYSCDQIGSKRGPDFPISDHDHGNARTRGGRGGTPKKNLVAVCGPRPKTLTLFMTEICDFPYPIHDLTKNSIAGLWQLRLTQLP